MASSSNSITSFDFVLDYLERLPERVIRYGVICLKMELRLVKTFFVCARKWRRSKLFDLLDERLRCIGTTFPTRISCIPSNVDDAYSASRRFGLWKEVRRFREDIIDVFLSDIKEAYNILLDDHCSLIEPDADQQRLRDLIDSLLEVLPDLLFYYDGWGTFRIVHNDLFEGLKALRGKLMFLKNFISFATMRLQGSFRHMQQLIDLLIHVEFVALNAARLIHISWHDRDDVQVCNRMQFEISQLLQHKIKLANVDPQVRETCIHVLVASKLTRSSSLLLPSTLEKDSYIVVANFIGCLLDNIMDLLESCRSVTLSVMNQVKILYDGLTFLEKLFGEWQEKLNVLDNKMKDLIGFVVCDAGIVIFSLSMNQMEEGLSKETDIGLSHLLKVLKFIMAEVAQIYPPTSSSSFSFPRTNALASLDFTLENLKELAGCEADSNAFPKDQIYNVQEDLSSLRSFLEKFGEQSNKNEKLQALWSRIMEVAYKAEFFIDSILVGDKTDCSVSMDTISDEIKFIMTEASGVYDNVRHDNEVQRVTKAFVHMPSQASTQALDEVLVGFDEEVKTIIDGLTRGSKQLDIVSIVGMPGLGKTTLANRVYNDPSIMCHFHIRAWCTVSQAYNKQSLLHQILVDNVSKSPDQYRKMNEDDLAEKLRKHLKRNKYLIVLDDVWDIEAWNCVKWSLPDDTYGSRILITSRFHNLASQIKQNSWVYHLQPLTDDESWALLRSKLFRREEVCPPALWAVGNQIAKSCKGLPLTVVIVAGILSSIERDCWEEFASSLSSSTVIETEYCMQTVNLSYRYLPDYLKPCLLYFSAFQEDQDISARKLKLLWISEGFVEKTEVKSSEDMAEDYLMQLIGRSLVMVTQQRSVGGVKTCRIHDLLHEFCVAKAQEESFLQIFHGYNGYNEHVCFSRLYNPRRLCIYSTVEESRLYNPRRLSTVEESKKPRLFFPHLRSFLFCSPLWHDESVWKFHFWLSKLVRVLDLGQFYFGKKFPREVELLVHLRYLAIFYETGSIPSTIANLARLETFIIKIHHGNVVLPNTVWNMKKLRHLWLEVVEGPEGPVGFSLPIEDLEVFPDLYHLDTINLAIDPFSENLQQILTKFPSIRRLKCVDIRSGWLEVVEGPLPIEDLEFFPDSYHLDTINLAIDPFSEHLQQILTNFPSIRRVNCVDIRSGESSESCKRTIELDSLSRLESLHVDYYGPAFSFPKNLKKLTLASCHQPWSEISTIGKLPHLEVLKLLWYAFVGTTWEMKEGEFPKLRILKLKSLDIVRWTASCDDLPSLQKLVLHHCAQLQEVPSGLGDVPTIEIIEVISCHESAVSLMKQIEKEQMDMGNEFLKIVIQ